MKKYRIYSVVILAIGILLASSSFSSFSFPCGSATHAPIFIDGNTALDTFCSSDGTDGLSWETAHVIENLEIDGGGTTIPIHITNTDRHLIIQGCTLEDGQQYYGCMYIQFCDNIQIKNCVMSEGHWETILIHDSNNITVANNEISNSGYGIGLWHLSATSNVTVTRNTITDLSGNGIVLDDAHNCTISFNTVENTNTYGINLYEGSNNNDVFSNCLKDCDLGEINDLGSNNNIYDNNCGIPGFPLFVLIPILGIAIAVGVLLTIRRIRKK